jgi:hypothetical protein
VRGRDRRRGAHLLARRQALQGYTILGPVSQ